VAEQAIGLDLLAGQFGDVDREKPLIVERGPRSAKIACRITW
jgi:hypothetical protein